LPSRFYQHALVATTKIACCAPLSSALGDTEPKVGERTRRSARSPMDGLLGAGQVPDLPVVDINLGPGLGGSTSPPSVSGSAADLGFSRAPRGLPAQPFAPATVAGAVLGRRARPRWARARPAR
jgi:hypothetical protein